MATLAANVNATEQLWTVSESIPDGARFFTVGDEIVEVTADFPAQYYSPTGETTPPKIRVDRGIAGSTAASHSSGATLTQIYAPSVGGGPGGEQEVYVQDADPGAVGAGKLWVQTVPGAPDGLRLQMWVRATGDAEWLPVGAADSVLGVVEAPGGTGITRYDADFLSLSDVVVSDTGGTVGLIRIDTMRSPGGEARAKWEQTDSGVLVTAFDDNEDSGASLELTPGGNATLESASLARINSDGDVESNGNTILTNPPIAAPASHVADGATVDDLRDALVAAGLMEPAP